MNSKLDDAFARSVALLRLACAATVNVSRRDRSPPDLGLDLALEEKDLRFLLGENLDSALYLAFDPDTPAQQLYQVLASHQMRLAAEIAPQFNAAGLNWAFVQGVEVTDAVLNGQAFGRRGDVDILVEDGDVTAMTEILLAHGLKQYALEAHQNKPIEVTGDVFEAIAKLQYYDKEFPFSEIQEFELPNEVEAIVPDILTPIFRDENRVFAFIGVEMVSAYSDRLCARDLLASRRADANGHYFLSPELNFLLSAKRLCDGLERIEPRLRILCELAARHERGLDLERLRNESWRYGEADAVEQTLELIAFILSKNGQERQPPSLLDNYLKAVLEGQLASERKA